MPDSITVAEFSFVVNKSFIGGGQRPITIPAHHYQSLRQLELKDTTPAGVKFGTHPIAEGAIRVGWRAGGRYYQVTVSKSDAHTALGGVKLGSKLLVRVIRSHERWLVEIA